MAATCQALTARETRNSCALERLYRFEPILATVLILALSPVFLLLAFTLALLSRRNPLIRHARVGRNGVALRMLKFRTMWPSARRSTLPGWDPELENWVPLDKRLPDPRVTSRFAAWCRRHSLDELPQLLHVVRGEMSLVGPRPVTAAELSRLYGSDARQVLSMRPGISGLWQVLGRNDLSDAGRRALDLYFVRAAAPRLYFSVLWLSLPVVFKGKGAY